MLIKLWHLFLAFGRAGVLGYGGGPSSIPLVQMEVVGNYAWMTVDEFAEVLALGNALPGPIATKMAGYIGFKVAGIPGALSALFGMVGPSFIAMILLYSALDLLKGNPYIGGMIRAVKPLVIVLLLMLIMDMYPSSFGSLLPYAIAVVTFIALRFLHVHPAAVVVSTLAFGALFMR